ncbi:MAG: DUF1543 domain-containing protein [Pseudobdellovibrionaceae bacterium]
MKLYLAHCGFYDDAISDGLYEGHTNFFVVAKNIQEAKAQVKKLAEFQSKKMHVDSTQEIHSVNGFNVVMQYDATLNGTTKIINCKNRDLAPIKS